MSISSKFRAACITLEDLKKAVDQAYDDLPKDTAVQFCTPEGYLPISHIMSTEERGTDLYLTLSGELDPSCFGNKIKVYHQSKTVE